MLDRLEQRLRQDLAALREEGRDKGAEAVIVGVRKPEGPSGPRYLIEGYGDRPFIRMNANAYLGMGLREELHTAESEEAARSGVGPGAVRFISGTFEAHRRLEKRIAAFHGREEAIIFNAAYTTVGGVLTSLLDKETAVISDELNHNCIINAIRMARPGSKAIYRHNSVAELEEKIREAEGARRLVVVTDGIFSMRGDHAPLAELQRMVDSYSDGFPEGALLMVDDSHGVGAFGATGRGTEEHTGARVDLLVGTLGKAFGVNGGYLAASETVVTYLREKAPMYIYSNPVSPGEAAAATTAIDLLDSDRGQAVLDHLKAMTGRFEAGLQKLGFEVIEGEHPVVPLMVRDTRKTAELVKWLTDHGVLATGLNYPVVPAGDEEIRFQVCADHTEADIDSVLGVLEAYPER
ncbi:MAG: aminotransferase class I/II-fold pyridoxal phosphate-dependent enzyme [Synergistales bacterium]|nr:aminotransferase class I/II-fold pyridoxal phosphate-dependent enzyme [Synergistales bacterium]